MKAPATRPGGRHAQRPGFIRERPDAEIRIENAWHGTIAATQRAGLVAELADWVRTLPKRREAA